MPVAPAALLFLLLATSATCGQTDLFEDIVSGLASSNKHTCSSTFFDDVIEDQLSPWKERGIRQSDLTGVQQMHAMKMTELGTVKIVNNQVYLRVTAFKYRIIRFTAFIFGALACRHKLPDVEFDFEVSGHIYNRFSTLQGHPPPPVFAYNRHRIYQPNLLLIPYQLASQNRRHLEKDFVLDAEMGIWERRHASAFWRGSTTGGSVNMSSVWDLPRTQLVLACRGLGALCNAKFSRVVQAREHKVPVTKMLEKEKLIGDIIPHEDVLRYKYLLLPDGNVAPTSRSINYFRAASVVLKTITPFEEFWYPKLIPFHHYIPLSLNEYEINNTLNWLRENDEHAQRIGKNARKFAMEHLTVAALECYVMRLLEGYAKLMRFKPSLEEADMEGYMPLNKLMSRFLVEQVNEGIGTTCFDMKLAREDDDLPAGFIDDGKKWREIF